LDDRVLDSLVVQYHHLPVVIEPAGGSKGHGAVRAYLETRPSKDIAISIEDRDYRALAEAQATWAEHSRKSFIWRRHEVENYLLHPIVVLELFNDFRGAGLAWAASLPGNESDTTALLRGLATQLLEDHAGAVLNHEVVRKINGIGSVAFGPPSPTPPAAQHFCGQAQWLPILQQEATRLCQTCTNVAALPDLQAAAIAASYQVRLAEFQNPAFRTSGSLLSDVAGKKILASLSRQLHGLHAPGQLTQSTLLADNLLAILARIYKPNALFQPDDFNELAAILRQH
jgi:hypothetical protein